MNLLTPEEIRECQDSNESETAKNLIAATVKKLAAGVSVEPVDLVQIKYGNETCARFPAEDYYTLSQLQTAIAEARVQENERCANLAANSHPDDWPFIAQAIRALLGKEAT